MAKTDRICVIPECGKRQQARGYCHMHYRRLRVNGDAGIVRTRKRGTCSIEGCDDITVGHGYCSKHYQRFMKHGDPNVVVGTPPGEAKRFLAETVLCYDGDDCLIWPYHRNSGGYGVVGEEEKATLVSRVVCERIHGEPPSPDHEAAHSCGNGHLGCCTPGHLRWATRLENQADRLIHGTSPRGENCGMAKLNDQQVREIRALRGIERQADIAREYGIGASAVSMILSRKLWAWLD